MSLQPNHIMMKSIFEHYQENRILTPKLRKLLLERLRSSRSPRRVKTLSDAIIDGFSWYYSPEGNDFWEKIYDMTKAYEDKTKVNF